VLHVQIDDVCVATCLSPAVSIGGDASRTCLLGGVWSGSALSCEVPDPCLRQPCQGYSECVHANNTNGYLCQCIVDAYGTPGPDGRGCTVPSLLVSNGTLTLTVSDQDDIVFNIGAVQSTSVLSLDSRLRAITTSTTGLIDTRVSTAISSLSASVDVRVATSQSTTIATLMSEITRQSNSVAVAAATDATMKSDNAVAVAAADATSKSNSALSTANMYTDNAVSSSQSQVTSALQYGDAQTLSTALQQLSVTNTALQSSIAGMKACYSAWI
jgi:hypothetical protein